MTAAGSRLALWRVELEWAVPQTAPVPAPVIRRLHDRFAAAGELSGTRVTRSLSHDGRQAVIFRAEVVAMTTAGAAADVVIALAQDASSEFEPTSTGNAARLRLDRLA